MKIIGKAVVSLLALAGATGLAYAGEGPLASTRLVQEDAGQEEEAGPDAHALAALLMRPTVVIVQAPGGCGCAGGAAGRTGWMGQDGSRAAPGPVMDQGVAVRLRAASAALYVVGMLFLLSLTSALVALTVFLARRSHVAPLNEVAGDPPAPPASPAPAV